MAAYRRISPWRPEFIYFIAPVGQDGPVKVGISADPAARCRALQVNSPLDLRVLASVPGTKGDERRIHALLLKDHWRGEWFRWSTKLSEVVEQARAGRLDFESFPDGVALYFEERRRAAMGVAA